MHGEKSIVVEKSHILIEFTFLVEDLMYEILLRISDSGDDETFLYEHSIVYWAFMLLIMIGALLYYLLSILDEVIL